MRKLLLLLAIATISFFSANAQFIFGGGLTLGTDWSVDNGIGLGLNARGNYELNSQWSISPGFTFVFPSKKNGIKRTNWQLNADAHYKFASSGDFTFYGIGGLNYSSIKLSSDVKADIPFGTVDISSEITDSEIGIDLGVGANHGKFYGEFKYDSAFKHVAISAGIYF